MNSIQLNLARKWRSKNFDQVIGQDLSIRILKNTLYLNQFFPVYLFSGQRGCGKTSTARIFAAAVNCEQLAIFQKNPKQSILPCLTCTSCTAMSQNQHPDFIEIDAASHTGVDNVRQIVEAASLLPLMGRKKIYLIDEAHMLSKAAFNAFLKVLEEPPAAVLFILATTDAQKIIETVRSRCFQLFFKPIGQECLVEHLSSICTQENIKYERDALSLIIHEAGGSVRDAINILEQVRFSNSMVSSAAVRQVLGHIDDERLLQLLSLVFKGEQKQLLVFCNKIALASFDASYVWKSLIHLMRALLWYKHGINKAQSALFGDVFVQLAQECSLMQLQHFLEHLYQHEIIFSKTTSPHSLLEMLLLQICYKNRSRSNSESSPLAQTAPGFESPFVAVRGGDEDSDTAIEPDEQENENDDENTHTYEKGWSTFINRITELNDPLLVSIFQQGVLVKRDQNHLMISFSSRLLFFKDWLNDTKNIWLPVFQSLFPDLIDIKSVFVEEEIATDMPISTAPLGQQVKHERVPIQTKQTIVEKSASSFVSKKQSFSFVAKKSAKRGTPIDVSNKEEWQKTDLILRYFPGTVTEIKENKHE